MLHKKLKFDRYGDNYSSFHQGVDISNGEINDWIEKAFNHAMRQFKNYPDTKQSFGTISSGNTKVFVEVYKQGNGKYSVFASVSKGYWRSIECDVEVN